MTCQHFEAGLGQDYCIRCGEVEPMHKHMVKVLDNPTVGMTVVYRGDTQRLCPMIINKISGHKNPTLIRASRIVEGVALSYWYHPNHLWAIE